MKRGYLFTALLFAVFMFPFIGNVSNADALGNYQCGNPDRKTHVNCLRAKLDSTPFGLTVPKGKRGLGKYGCGTKKRRKHVNCLRSLLDQHGPFLAKGATGQVPPMGQPGMNPPAKSDDGLMGAPVTVPGIDPGYAPGTNPGIAPVPAQQEGRQQLEREEKRRKNKRRKGLGKDPRQAPGTNPEIAPGYEQQDELQQKDTREREREKKRQRNKRRKKER